MTAVLVAVLVAAAVRALPAPAHRRLGRLARSARLDRSGRAVGAGAPARTRSLLQRTAVRHTDVAAVVAELATLTRGGLMPAAAWAAVASGLGSDPVAQALQRAADAGAKGLPVAPALRLRTGTRLRPPELKALATLAATWQVQEATGAPVAELMERAAAGLRADADADLARRSAMAAPVATARVLVALPLLGLALGVAVGADPVQVLVTTPAGRVSAVVGAVAAATGWWWTRALLRRANRTP